LSQGDEGENGAGKMSEPSLKQPFEATAQYCWRCCGHITKMSINSKRVVGMYCPCHNRPDILVITDEKINDDIAGPPRKLVRVNTALCAFGHGAITDEISHGVYARIKG